MINFTDLEGIVNNQEKVEVLLQLFAREYVDLTKDEFEHFCKAGMQEEMACLMGVILETVIRCREEAQTMAKDAFEEARASMKKEGGHGEA